MVRKKIRWKTAAIPENLYNQAKRIYQKFGYSSLNELVKDSVRRRIEELQIKEHEKPLAVIS